eukprot:2656545-Pyramimonas_sp.AAC.1
MLPGEDVASYRTAGECSRNERLCCLRARVSAGSVCVWEDPRVSRKRRSPNPNWLDVPWMFPECSLNVP